MRDKKDLASKDLYSSFEGLERETLFTPDLPSRTLPITVTRFGITNPDPTYHIKRENSPVYIIEYIVSGRGFLKINGKKYKLEAGDAYIIHSGDKCEYYSDKSNPYKKYWINFEPKYFFTEMINAYGIKERVFRGLDLSGYFEKIFDLKSKPLLNETLYIHISRILFSIVLDIAEYNEKKNNDSHEELAAMIQLKLRQSINKNVTIEDIAREFYRTPNDIIYRFKKKFGITPYAHLIDLRISMAKELLTNTDKSIKAISDYLCFFSEYHFSNTFKKKVGVSPREFRKSKA